MVLEWLDASNLRSVHIVLAIAGVFLSLFMMQLWGTGELKRDESKFFMHARRASFGALALTLLWSVSYADAKDWQPWPPAVATVLVLDFFMLISVLSAKVRSWRIQKEESKRQQWRKGYPAI